MRSRMRSWILSFQSSTSRMTTPCMTSYYDKQWNMKLPNIQQIL